MTVTSTILLSGSEAAAFDLATSFVGQPKTIAYGLVRGAGNLVFQQQLSDNSIVAFYLLGEGPWDSLVRIWLDGVATGLPSSQVQFHNGFDGEIGFGMAAVSTGGDQHVDSFFSLVPGGLTPIDWSRYAYLAIHYPPNPLAPDANLSVIADYQAMRCRIFDGSGNQTAFQWTQNPAWWILDFLIRKFILREGKVNQPLVAAELARFDWAAWQAAAQYCDQTIPAGPPRFSDGGLVFLQSGVSATNALEQMLLLCQGYLLERNGKLTLYMDQPRSSVYLATIDALVPGSFNPYKQKLQSGQNRITATWREEARAAGSTDDGTRMTISTVQFDHIAHQTAVGARGAGLAVMPHVNELQLDFGINTAERVSRFCQFYLQRQLGVDLDPNYPYVAPFQCDLICYEHSLAVEAGDIITIDGSISEEFAAREFEVLQIEERPDGTRKFTCLEYIAGAFGDTALPRQTTQAPIPGTGLSFPYQLSQLATPVGVGGNAVANPGFEENLINAPVATDIALGCDVCDGWFVAGSAPGIVQIQRTTAAKNSGAYSVSMVANTGVTLAANTSYESLVISRQHIPVSVGELVRVSAMVNLAFNVVSGVSTSIQIGLQILDSAGHAMYILASSVGTGASWQLIQAALQIPSVVTGGGAPAYARFFIDAFVINTTGSGIAVGANQVCNAYFDDVRCVIQATAFDLTPLNTAGVPTASNVCTQSGTTTTISVAASTIQFGDGQVSYNAGSVNPGSYGTWYVYADDPTFAGGAVTYQATSNPAVLTAANGRILFGKVTTAGGGGGASGATGGAGACFSPNTRVMTPAGPRRFDEIEVGQYVETEGGPMPIARVFVHKFSGEMLDMGGGELVTEDHPIRGERQWLPAAAFFRGPIAFDGYVYNLEVLTDRDDRRNYRLGNGRLAHNVKFSRI